MKNHFHFLVRIKDWRSCQDRQSCAPSHAFAVLFSTYTKAFNKAYQRTGSLFDTWPGGPRAPPGTCVQGKFAVTSAGECQGKPFRHKLVDSDRYFTHLVAYIHRNLVKHGFVDDCRNWPYFSYRAVLSTKPTRVQRTTVLDWFGGRPAFQEALEVEEGVIEAQIVEDWM